MVLGVKVLANFISSIWLKAPRTLPLPHFKVRTRTVFVRDVHPQNLCPVNHHSMVERAPSEVFISYTFTVPKHD